jgi:23S rRNA pseudouridine2457 synthase
MARLILLNKPFGVLCQFTSDDGRPCLRDFLSEPDVYAAGRLDADSEGLLLLTDDGGLQHRLSHPRHKTWKTYWAQVEGTPDEQALEQLRRGVALKDGLTLPARVRPLEPPEIWPRDPPVRYRKTVPTQWVEIGIREGRNRQIRRMTAAVGHPTLRLVRVSVGRWRLRGLQPGQWVEVPPPIPARRVR